MLDFPDFRRHEKCMWLLAPLEFFELNQSYLTRLVIYNFHGKGLYQLQLQLGETVQILEESAGKNFGSILITESVSKVKLIDFKVQLRFLYMYPQLWLAVSIIEFVALSDICSDRQSIGVLLEKI